MNESIVVEFHHIMFKMVGYFDRWELEIWREMCMHCVYLWQNRSIDSPNINNESCNHQYEIWDPPCQTDSWLKPTHTSGYKRFFLLFFFHRRFSSLFFFFWPIDRQAVFVFLPRLFLFGFPSSFPFLAHSFQHDVRLITIQLIIICLAEYIRLNSSAWWNRQDPTKNQLGHCMVVSNNVSLSHTMCVCVYGYWELGNIFEFLHFNIFHLWSICESIIVLIKYIFVDRRYAIESKCTIYGWSMKNISLSTYQNQKKTK